MRLFWAAVFLCALLAVSGCSSEANASPSPSPEATPTPATATPSPSPSPVPSVRADATVLEERFLPPPGYLRTAADSDSFAAYLRRLPLRPHDTKVYHFDGAVKSEPVWAAVIDLDIGKSDVQQNTRTLIRLRAEYLYARQQYDKIAFRFMSGFLFDFPTWAEGGRVDVSGSTVSWKRTTNQSDDYLSFIAYLQTLFLYANATSLATDTVTASDDIQPGDIYISGASGVMVVDVARNAQTGEVLCLLAQGRKPAEDIHIVINAEDETFSPWYKVTPDGTLVTPEASFTADERRRFQDG